MRIGIDLGGSKIEIIALGDKGEVLYHQRVATPAGDYAQTVKTIAGLVASAESETGCPGRVGIGIPGTISPESGLVKNANSLWLIGKPFDRDLEAALERPVRLANDANCFALSEAVDGSGAGFHCVFGVILGTGVGGGGVIDGKLLTGANAIAGEWGHNPLPLPGADERPGPPCYCGRNGCIETFVSGPGIARDHFASTGRKLEAWEIAAFAEAGNGGAERTLRRFEDRLARSLAGVINILDPDCIVLGGGLSKIDRLYRDLPPMWKKYVFSDTVRTKLAAPKFGDSSGVRGAAWLWP